MYRMLWPLDVVYFVQFSSEAIIEIHYPDGHYTILLLIKSLKLVSVLQMLSWGFTSVAIFS